MKKILLALIAVTTLFTACESTFNDQFEGLEESIRAPYLDELSVTLEDADYETISDEALKDAVTDDEISDAEDIAKYKNFSKYVDPIKYIHYYLNVAYPAFDKGAFCEVTFDYYAGLPDYLPYGDVDTYTLEDADYDAMGTGPGKYNNFSSYDEPEDYLPAFLATKYPDAVDGDGYLIFYDYYAGSVTEMADYYVFDGSDWSAAPNTYYLSDDDYDSMGAPGNYNNFSESDEPDDYLPTFLSIRFPYAVAGDSKIIAYKYFIYDGYVTENNMDEYNFDGTTWTKTVSTIQQTLLFGFDGTTWAYVPPIKFIETTKAFTVEYTLTDADFDLVGNGNYNNFDVREGKDEETIEVRIEKLTTILKYNFDVVEGDVYSVTYDVYDGANTTMTTVLEAVPDVK